MNSTKMNHITRQQRDDLRALAKRLDTVPAKKLIMSRWVTHIATNMLDDGSYHLPKQCGYAGCGIGWGMSMSRFRQYKGKPLELALKLGCAKKDGFGSLSFNRKGMALFRGGRNVTPKELANDIRRWVNHGELPVY